MLDILIERGSYNPQSALGSWVWDTKSGTLRIMFALYKRGLVKIINGIFYPIDSQTQQTEAVIDDCTVDHAIGKTVEKPEYELAKMVLEYWNDHQYDTINLGDGEEKNYFNKTPEFVLLAKKILNQAK